MMIRYCFMITCILMIKTELNCVMHHGMIKQLSNEANTLTRNYHNKP